MFFHLAQIIIHGLNIVIHLISSRTSKRGVKFKCLLSVLTPIAVADLRMMSPLSPIFYFHAVFGKKVYQIIDWRAWGRRPPLSEILDPALSPSAVT